MLRRVAQPAVVRAWRAPPRPQARSARHCVAATARAEAPALELQPGSASPLGPSPVVGAGVNFSLWSKNASEVTLCLFLSPESSSPDVTFPLARSGDVWHGLVAGCPLVGVRYAYRVDGPRGWDKGHRYDPAVLLLDPRAPLVEGRSSFGDASKPPGAGRWTGAFDFASPPFDWEGTAPPAVDPAAAVVYEVGVRSFTGSPTSGLPAELRGTFLGLASKAAYLKQLGVTAVELLPVFEYDELEFTRPKPDGRLGARAHMVNTWGYSHVSFFAPATRLGTQGGGAARAAADFKVMVRELHRAGIAVWLDVVYNHTAEGGDDDPYTTSLRGIDHSEYYIVDPSGRPGGASGDAGTQVKNFSGCGNSLSANGPAGRQLVLDSLAHWATEYRVDGFRFDLASALCRAPVTGAPLDEPPLVRDIAQHPALARCALVAEPWDAAGLYQVGTFPAFGRWAEWNGPFRDTCRRLLRGAAGQKRAFASRMAGSADMYARSGRKPWHSVNFVTCHDGFTLADLVSYAAKHNDANGEGGRDGSNDNESWNCGAEGWTAGGEGVAALRDRQMRNALLMLLLSAGTPMLLFGDEVAHSKGGNNNTYGLDGPVNDLDWAAAAADPRRAALRRFTTAAAAFRGSHPALRRGEFLGPGDVMWHEAHWEDDDSRFLAWTLHAPAGGGGDDGGGGGGGGGPAGGAAAPGPGDLYIAFNAHGFPIADLPLPAAPRGRAWGRVADTALPPPRDFDPSAARLVGPTYTVAPHSALLLMAVVPPQVQSKL